MYVLLLCCPVLTFMTAQAVEYHVSYMAGGRESVAALPDQINRLSFTATLFDMAQQMGIGLPTCCQARHHPLGCLCTFVTPQPHACAATAERGGS